MTQIPVSIQASIGHYSMGIPAAVLFLLIAAILIAPHMTWPEAKNWACICILAAVIFGVVSCLR